MITIISYIGLLTGVLFFTLFVYVSLLKIKLI
uniref:Cytochrome b6-f complex subunit 6 n=1 Tax=Pseudochlorella signiensis TaxID=173497 RepID=A0A097KKV0_9CHLO|nr:subunit VI of cytochrome b6/f complex [Pseudochlorella signiensis]AIT93819.1 subunit VI of cytochrome b6/f complex [Pseudochlorella signiensis]